MRKAVVTDIIKYLLIVSLVFIIPLSHFGLKAKRDFMRTANEQTRTIALVAKIIEGIVEELSKEYEFLNQEDIVEKIQTYADSDTFINKIIYTQNLRIRLINKDFNVLFDNYQLFDYYDYHNIVNDPEIRDCFSNNKLYSTTRRTYDYVSILYVAYPITFKAKDSPDYVVFISTPVLSGSRYRKLESLLIVLIVFIVVVILIFALILKICFVSPIVLLTEETAKVADENGKITKTVLYGNEREDEIGTLSKSFSKVIEKVNYRINEIESLSTDLSHEIKNPLSVITNIAEFLESEDLTNEERKQFSESIINEAKKINNIISKIREATKIENKIYEASKENVELDTFIQNFEISFIKNYPTLKIQNDLNLFDRKIEINPELLNILFSNLLTNAASFADTIRITTEIDSKSKILIEIEDNGPGIPESEREKVFMRFYSHRKDEDQSKHDGLGLYLVKYIINSINGSISISDGKELAGALFQIELPIL